MSKETRKTNLHSLPNFGTRKRVPFQPLSDETKKNRNSTRTVSDRKTDKNLVPKQEDEAEEGTQSC